MVSPLDGIRVLDLSRLLPGPFASLVLADLGATVDKLEDPGAGDYLRHMPPGLPDASGATQSSLFLFLNRNKRSLVLDLKKPEGVHALERLLPHYDVVLEQFRPGVLARLGLSPEAMRRINPRLVVCSLSGYGREGPLAQRAGHDIDYMARAGALFGQGPADGAPTTPGVQVADIGSGLWCVIGIMAALAARARTGEGSHVDVSLLEAALSFAIVPFGSLAGGVELHPAGGNITGGIAGYSTYATKDGRAVALGALEPKFLQAFCKAVDIPLDPEMLVFGPHQRAIQDRFAALFREKTLSEWIAIAEKGDFCLEPVLTPRECLDDPQLAARGAFFRLRSPWGELLQMRLPTTPREMEHRAPPRAGEHSREILRDAGFSDQEIAALAGS
jgi:crotonobetainyl-CoA:carnitine CoA-transferase CaiB-like acyl-CoA transferase